jgi:anti-sigma factor ChrR (cupin superfamily)
VPPETKLPVFDDVLAAAIAADVEPERAVPPADRRRLFDRISDEIGFGDEHRYLPARDGDWRVLGDRVYIKVLQRDDATGQATYLVRYGPGTQFPVHPQRTTEECLLVAGDLRIGDVDMQPGDLQIAVPGIPHGPLVSQRGALVFVRGVLSRVPERVADDAFRLLPPLATGA